MAGSIGQLSASIKSDPTAPPVVSVRSGNPPTVVYSSTPTQAQIDAVNAILARHEHYLAVLDGVVDLADGDHVPVSADGVETKELTFQYRLGNDADDNGGGESVVVVPSTLAPLSALSGALDGTGKMTLTVGPSTLRGHVKLEISAAPMPVRRVCVCFV